MIFGGRYKTFYPASTSHSLQKQLESSVTTGVNPRPLPFSPAEDPCRERGVDSLYEKIKEAGLSFLFRTDIPKADKAEYQRNCVNAVRNFFEYLNEEGQGRMRDFERALNKLSSGSGGYKSVPEKKIIIAPPGEMPDGLSITNLDDRFCWNGQPEVLFETLLSLERMNMAPSGTVKHYPVLPRSGEEAAWMREQIKTYLERYGPSLTLEQRQRIEDVLKQSDAEAEVPETLHGIWFKLSKDIPQDCLENIASFLQRMPTWRSIISTNKVDSVSGSIRKFGAQMKGNAEIASALERMEARSDKDFYEHADISVELKKRIRKAIDRELHPASRESAPNAPGASDFFRLCILLLDPGMYMDLDTKVPQRLPKKMYAFFGVQLALIIRPDLQKPTDTNQFIMANNSRFAKEMLERVLERMVTAYEQNPDLSRLIRHGPYPDERSLDSLRLDALKGLSIKERFQAFLRTGKSLEKQRLLLDKKVMERKEYDPKTKQVMTLLIGNQLCQVAKELYGEHVLDQLPDAIGFLGKLWQNGHINALSELKWNGAERPRITPKIYSSDAVDAKDSSVSLASVKKDIQFPDNQMVPLSASPLWRR
jgi:hypothetical protein